MCQEQAGGEKDIDGFIEPTEGKEQVQQGHMLIYVFMKDLGGLIYINNTTRSQGYKTKYCTLYISNQAQSHLTSYL